MSSVDGRRRRAGSQRMRAAAFAATAAVLVALAASGASAATDPVPPPVTDYATYPQDLLFPPGCTVDGAGVLVGLAFTARGESRASLRELVLGPGDVVTMSWSGFAPGCEGIGVSLSVKKTNTPAFDPADNQQLLRPYDYCGPGGVACSPGSDGRYQLRLEVPAREVSCNYQIDAAIGPPLEVVGPAGSYYTTGNREANGKPGGPEMLISAYNGGVGDCTRTLVRVDKLWVAAGSTSPIPPSGLAGDFAVIVSSRDSGGRLLGTTTCRYAGSAFVCSTTDASGTALAGLPVAADGTLEVVERAAPAGFRAEPSGPIQLADRYVACATDGCRLTVTNTGDGPTTTTTPPTTAPPTTVPPTTAPPGTTTPATTVPGSDVGGTGTGTGTGNAPTSPPAAHAASAASSLPRTGAGDQVPVLVAASLLVGLGALLVGNAALRRPRR
ncbi:MAG: hypothetical protein IPM45_10615 [Acidimicrobiales bacterium]|nr:hypothetical protein [Acidimicrobiales bacterium]